MKEDREAYLLTASIKTSVDNDMVQATSAADQVGSVSVSLTQLVTNGAGGRLDVMHQPLNVGDQNIGILQQTLTGLCSLVGSLGQKMNHLS